MKPNPFALLNHFTLPLMRDTCVIPPCIPSPPQSGWTCRADRRNGGSTAGAGHWRCRRVDRTGTGLSSAFGSFLPPSCSTLAWRTAPKQLLGRRFDYELTPGCEASSCAHGPVHGGGGERR